MTSIERTIGRFSEWLDKQSDEIRSPENEADTGYECKWVLTKFSSLNLVEIRITKYEIRLLDFRRRRT